MRQTAVHRTFPTRRAARWSAALGFLFLLAGCASRPPVVVNALDAPAAARPTLEAARGVTMLDGIDGTPLSFEDVMARVAEVDVVVLGETHNDAEAHAFQAAVVDAMFARWPDAAVALEMLERDEQVLVTDYLEGVIDLRTFMDLTHSASWAGAGSWRGWYQPVIERAKTDRDAGARVVAANAPRRYVRLARTDGYDRLRSMDETRRAWFEIPDEASGGTYAERFREFMGAPELEGDPDTWTDDERAASARVDAVFRSQSVWDATMARSVIGAWQDGASRVALLVGQFHSDFNGGVVQQMFNADRSVRVLVISLQPTDDSALRDEDDGRADIVVFTK